MSLDRFITAASDYDQRVNDANRCSALRSQCRTFAAERSWNLRCFRPLPS